MSTRFQNDNPSKETTASRMRNHHERMVLTYLREHGETPGVTLSRALDFSAQTASVITKSLEEQGFIEKRAPIKGKVGKPQTPFALAETGAYSVGMRIGRRAVDMILVDFLGTLIAEHSRPYAYPTPERITSFAAETLDIFFNTLPDTKKNRVIGIGIAAPYELWNWADALGAPKGEAEAWRNHDFNRAFAQFTDLPIHVTNDVNTACVGERHFGIGKSLRDFCYIYLGAFVGGAVVLDGTVLHGQNGNAGALGSVLVNVKGETRQLIDAASLFSLERQLGAKHDRIVNLRAEPDYWDSEQDLVSNWIDQATDAVAQAAVSTGAILDVATTVIDGVFPPHIRSRFVDEMTLALTKVNQNGIKPMQVQSGTLGPEAGPLGAAYQPILSGLLIDGSTFS